MDCARAARLPVGHWPDARVQLAGKPASAYLSSCNTEIIGILLKTNRDDSTLLAEGGGDCEPPAVRQPALAGREDRAFPDPQMRGTWGTREGGAHGGARASSLRDSYLMVGLSNPTLKRGANNRCAIRRGRRTAGGVERLYTSPFWGLQSESLRFRLGTPIRKLPLPPEITSGGSWSPTHSR
jgi:hypothetical protein